MQKYNSVYQHLSISQSHFNETVAVVLDNVATGDAKADGELLGHIANCLKVRKAIQLPVGAKTEIVFELSEVMSFALVCSIAIEYYVKNNPEPLNQQYYAAMLIPEQISTVGYAWLKQYKPALNELIFYLTNKNHSAFAGIVDTVIPRNATTQPLDFVGWLTQEVQANRTPQGIYRHDGGVFIQLPEGLERYAILVSSQVNTVRNRIFRQGLHREENGRKIHSIDNKSGLILSVDIPGSGILGEI